MNYHHIRSASNQISTFKRDKCTKSVDFNCFHRANGFASSPFATIDTYHKWIYIIFIMNFTRMHVNSRSHHLFQFVLKMDNILVLNHQASHLSKSFTLDVICYEQHTLAFQRRWFWSLSTFGWNLKNVNKSSLLTWVNGSPSSDINLLVYSLDSVPLPSESRIWKAFNSFSAEAGSILIPMNGTVIKMRVLMVFLFNSNSHLLVFSQQLGDMW